MALDPRSFAVATAGFAAFVNLYSPQALLPKLADEFHVGPGEISALMTTSTAAIALSAPFTGALADVAGRKRLITAAMFAVVAPTLIMIFAVKDRQIGILIDRLLEIVTLNGKTSEVPQLLAKRNAPRFRDMIEKIIETRDDDREPVTTLILDVSRFVDSMYPTSEAAIGAEAGETA